MKYNKIYVLTLYNFSTGGVELSHQLVDYLRNKGQEAYIVYVKNGESFVDCPVNKSYLNYNISVATEIVDDPMNMMVLPEIFFKFGDTYKKIKIGYWWMSVDNYFNAACLHEKVMFAKGIMNKLSQFVHPSNYKLDVSILKIKKEERRSIHLYQSHYASYFLHSKGIFNTLSLSDYINTEFATSNSTEKKDIVLYNPAKGYKFTKKLIKRMPDIEFVPLKGLTREQLVQRFKEAKIYIDFGNHPGKDRMPREAAICMCCIITGKEGSAKFFEDIPISDKYKFDQKKDSISSIEAQIRNVIANYNKRISDFSFYRKRILKEKEVFYSEISTVFDL